jgi:hypothetical protein
MPPGKRRLASHQFAPAMQPSTRAFSDGLDYWRQQQRHAEYTCRPTRATSDGASQPMSACRIPSSCCLRQVSTCVVTSHATTSHPPPIQPRRPGAKLGTCTMLHFATAESQWHTIPDDALIRQQCCASCACGGKLRHSACRVVDDDCNPDPPTTPRASGHFTLIMPHECLSLPSTRRMSTADGTCVDVHARTRSVQHAHMPPCAVPNSI